MGRHRRHGVEVQGRGGFGGEGLPWRASRGEDWRAGYWKKGGEGGSGWEDWKNGGGLARFSFSFIPAGELLGYKFEMGRICDS